MTHSAARRLDHRVDAEAGFTLLEMLVALVLLALAAALLPATLQLGVRGMSAGEVLDAREGIAAARQFLVTRLSEAQPRFHARNAGAVRLDFDGGADAVTFVAPAPTSDRLHGLVRYRVSGHDGGVSVSIVDSEAEKTVSPARTQRLAGAEVFSLRYFGRKAKDERAVWHEDWQGERVLPRLVEFRLSRRDDATPTRVALRLAPPD